MRAPEYSTEDMETDQLDITGEWTSDKLCRIRDHFVANRSISKAISLLEELLGARVEDIDDDIWMDVRDLLVAIFDTVPIQIMLESHQIVLLNVINHSPDKVVDLVARHYIEPNIAKIVEVMKTNALAITVAQARRIPGEVCYEALAKILWRFIEVKEVVKEFEEQLKSANSSLRFHVHHVTGLALKNKPSDYNGAGLHLLVEAVIKEADSSDILSSLSALELLCDATSDHVENAQLFQSMGLVGKMYELMQTLKNEPEGGFLYPVCVRFFAHLSVVDPEALNKYPIFVSSVLDMVYHFDLLDAPQRALAFETLAVVASTSSAKKILSEYKGDYNMDKAMNHFGAACASGPVELRIRHLDALTLMFSKSHSSQDSEILNNWYTHLGEPFTELILGYLKKPFVDLRITALHFVNMMGGYEWAIKIFFHTPGFADYLVDRNVETTADGNQLKYEIVSKIVDSDSNAVDAPDMVRLKLYKRQGVYYKEHDPGLAMESNQ